MNDFISLVCFIPFNDNNKKQADENLGSDADLKKAKENIDNLLNNKGDTINLKKWKEYLEERINEKIQIDNKIRKSEKVKNLQDKINQINLILETIYSKLEKNSLSENRKKELEKTEKELEKKLDNLKKNIGKGDCSNCGKKLNSYQADKKCFQCQRKDIKT